MREETTPAGGERSGEPRGKALEVGRLTVSGSRLVGIRSLCVGKRGVGENSG